MKNHFLSYLMLFLIAGFAWGREEVEKYNVLLVSIDSLRSDHLGCYGYKQPTSPVIDQLAQNGILFKNTISTTSWTLPAHISLFTSMDIMVHGVKEGVSLHKDIGSLAQELKKNGYQTAAFCSSPYMNPAFGHDRGFDLYHNIDVADHRFKDTVIPPPEERDAVHADVTSPEITELACEWLENNRRDPFFLFIHMWDVHYDYIPPEPYDRKFDPDYTGDIDGRGFILNPKVNPEMNERDLKHIIALYDGEIAWVDFHLGLIIGKLKELGLFENTQIVVTADHGDEFFEHGGKGHRFTLYDEVVRIPLVIHGPGKANGGLEISRQASIIDIAPTILDLCGFETPGWMQGEPLLAVKKTETGPESEALLELDTGLKALRTNSYKLLFSRHLCRGIIFDLIRGPEESQKNIIKSPEKWDEINWKFYSRLALDRSLARKYRGGKSGSRVKLSKEEESRLKSLGYL